MLDLRLHPKTYVHNSATAPDSPGSGAPVALALRAAASALEGTAVAAGGEGDVPVRFDARHEQDAKTQHRLP